MNMKMVCEIIKEDLLGFIREQHRCFSYKAIMDIETQLSEGSFISEVFTFQPAEFISTFVEENMEAMEEIFDDPDEFVTIGDSVIESIEEDNVVLIGGHIEKKVLFMGISDEVGSTFHFFKIYKDVDLQIT